MTSLKVFPHERREGMRRVQVTVAVGDSGADRNVMTIDEWVPVVLLRRVAVGATVGLTPDPLEPDRLTLAL